MEKIEKNQSTKTWDAIPEIGQYNVRYEEYTLKDPNIVNKLSQDKRPFLAYGNCLLKFKYIWFYIEYFNFF
ncbi:Hypothetical protein CINCED_3A005708 [Cinara cedri]|uniref:Uncharacterized protein n=1 Tax=Cinara cedri TaxID=506608 RepID=A0A5E4NRP2_9HEMI|nr:Hypothetical protein CINCED_3A005708 [Cinara cedri]